ncbi:MAG: hypothetical protein ACKV2T_30115 [Kofleriaceae bacterium]
MNDFASQSCAFGGNSTGPDIAFSLFLPVPVATLVVETTGSAHPDTQLSVRDANCGVELGCDDDGGTSNNSLVTLSNVNAGNYAIIVDGYNGANGAVSLSVVGTVKPGASCVSPLFGTGVLVCPAGTSCTGTPARCQ